MFVCVYVCVCIWLNMCPPLWVDVLASLTVFGCASAPTLESALAMSLTVPGGVRAPVCLNVYSLRLEDDFSGW